MEYQLAAAEEDLIQSLDFKIGQTAKHVQNRRSVSFYPSGAGTFSNRGVRVIRVTLTSENGWIDPSTLRLQFAIRNLDGTANHVVQPVSGPHCFFERVRCFMGGALIEDVQNYAKTHELMQRLSPTDYLWNESVEGFGLARSLAIASQSADPSPCWIPEDQQLTVMMKPSLGLLQAQKMLPIRWAPLTLEFYMSSSHEAVQPVGGAPAIVQVAGTAYTRVDAYEINNVQIKCDLINLDSALENSFAELMLKDRALTFSLPVYITQQQAVTGDRPVLAITRALTRLNGIIISFARNDDPECTMFRYPGAPRVGPMFARFDRPLQLQVGVGAKLFPETAISSTAEFYEHLRKLVAHHDDKGSVDIDLRQYESDTFIVGISTQTVTDGLFSGTNTRSGDLVTIRLNSFQDGTG